LRRPGKVKRGFRIQDSGFRALVGVKGFDQLALDATAMCLFPES
jgi:hypothetical protein